MVQDHHHQNNGCCRGKCSYAGYEDPGWGWGRDDAGECYDDDAGGFRFLKGVICCPLNLVIIAVEVVKCFTDPLVPRKSSRASCRKKYEAKNAAFSHQCGYPNKGLLDLCQSFQ